MNCNCNNKDNALKPAIPHVFGNVLRLAIPLTLRTVEFIDGEVEVTDTDFIPSSDYPISVVIDKGAIKLALNVTMHDGNIVFVEDKGKIPVGSYGITVICYDDNGNPYRFKQNMVLQVFDTTSEAGITSPIEYEVKTWYLNAAIFLSLKGEDGIGIEDIEIETSGEIGGTNTITIILTDGRTKSFSVLNGSGAVDSVFDINSPRPIANNVVTEKFNDVDGNFQKVFGSIRYDSESRMILFFPKGTIDKSKENAIATLDATPFVKDGMVNSVYISNNTLVVTFNTDSGKQPIGVPLTSIFNPNNYYNKTQVDNRISTAIATAIAGIGNGKVNAVMMNGSTKTPDSNGIVNLGTVLTQHQDISGKANSADLATVATSGSYNDLDNRPSIPSKVSDLTNDSGFATTDDVDTAIAALVSSAPSTLDTLNELAQALGDDPNFATTVATQLGNKVDKETGKGLSTNDYTTAEKTKLAGLSNYDDTALSGRVTAIENGKESKQREVVSLTLDDFDSPIFEDSSSNAISHNEMKQLLDNDGKDVVILYDDFVYTLVSVFKDTTFTTWYFASIANSGYGLDVISLMYESGMFSFDINNNRFVPVDRKINGKALSSNITLTAADVNALPSNTAIPTKVSQLTNDSGFTSNVGTITGITMNGASKGTSGVVDLGTVITAHQDISGKANSAELATVATSGSYNDLDDKPTIPAAQVQSDWNATSGMGVILNKPTIPSKTSDLTNDSGYINKSVFAGTCSTAAATMPKVCTVDTFPTTESNGVTHAADGTMVAVMFINSDTNTSAAPTLNVNNIGAKAIYYSNAKVTSTAKNTTIAGTAKVLAYYYYDSSLDEGNGAWVYMGKSADSNSTYSQASLGQGYGSQTNTAAATAITSSISSYALSAGGIVTIKFTYDVPANATLNISSKGAKAIYNKGAAIQAGVIKAGDTATFIYSTYYHLLSVDSWQDNQGGSVTVDSAPTSGSTNAVSSGGVYTALAGKADTSTTYTKSEIDTKIGNIETLLASI